MTDGDAAAALAAARRRLEAQVAALDRSHDDIVEASELVATDDEHDPDGATIAFERAQVAALRRDARVLLEEILAAERRLAAGTYGRCVDCGVRIPAARLEARPATSTCVDCAI